MFGAEMAQQWALMAQQWHNRGRGDPVSNWDVIRTFSSSLLLFGTCLVGHLYYGVICYRTF